MATITAHCIVKNEENFVGYAIRSVVDFVDRVLVYDTGSTDKTVAIIAGLAKEYPDKISFEEKGPVDKVRHTQLRQEMLDRTTTDWFMILDGDEVWTKRGIEESLGIIKKAQQNVACIICPYYLCVGDIYHHSIRGEYVYDGEKMHALARIFKKNVDTRWNPGPYGEGDYIRDDEGNVIRKGAYIFVKNKYWHASALVRSSKDSEVNLGRHKQVMTYSLKIIGEGFNIKETVPEVFFEQPSLATKRMLFLKSGVNLLTLLLFKCGLVQRRYIYG